MFGAARNKSSSHIKKRGITSLPNELLLEIFKYLNPEDLVANVVSVSRRWRTLALDPSVWYFQTILDKHIRSGLGLQILSVAPVLQSVEIRKASSPNDVYHALISGYKDVKKLCIHFLDDCFTAPQFCDLLIHFPNLQELDLQLPASTKDINAALTTLPKVLKITLSGVVTDSDDFIDALRQCTTLKKLDLSGCRIILRDYHLAWLINSDIVWEALHIVTHFVSDEGYGVIGQSKSLRELTLLKCRNLSSASLDRLAVLTELSALAIKENCVLSAAALTSFFNKDTVAQLVKVDLTVYRADDDVALTISTNCTGLMHLRLAMCLLTDKGVRDIVLNAPNLTHLDLEFNNISGEALLLIPKFLPNLAYLNLHLCYNVHVDLLQLAQTLPNFTIIDPTGFPISTSGHGITLASTV